MQASIQRARASAARGLQSVRRFSAGGSPEELKKETLDWKKYSIVMFGLTGAVTAYNLAVHSHDHPRTDMPYMRIRNKPYPWRECPDCNIMDGDCWAKCRGQEVSDHH